MIAEQTVSNDKFFKNSQNIVTKTTKIRTLVQINQCKIMIIPLILHWLILRTSTVIWCIEIRKLHKLYI